MRSAIKMPKRVDILKLLSFLPENILDEIAEKTNVDYQVKKLNGKVFFMLLLYGVLKNNRVSTRVLEFYFNTPGFSKLSGKVNQKTRHSSIADRIKNVEVKYFQMLFEVTRQRIEKEYDNSTSIVVRNILRFDSTMVAVSAKLIHQGMDIGKKARLKPAKKQIKYTVGLKNDLPSDIHLFTQKSYLNEDRSIGEAISKSSTRVDSIVVFDRGVNDRSVYDRLQDENTMFVTRCKPNVVYKSLEVHDKVTGRHTDKLQFQQDEIICLFSGKHVRTRYNYRLITALRENEEKITFLTNILTLSCEEVAELYKRRWDIEVFFKFLKQELNFSKLLSNTKNGIEVMMYVRLIAAMLILLYKKKNKIEGFKIARLAFETDLEMQVVKEIIKACDGKPELFDKLFNSHGFT